MASFPTLSMTNTPLQAGYSEAYAEIGDLVSPTDSGYKVTRRRFTRRPAVFTMSYQPLTDSDKATMESFILDHGTTTAFVWTQPKTNSQKTVRFTKLPVFSALSGNYWAMTGLELEEV